MKRLKKKNKEKKLIQFVCVQKKKFTDAASELKIPIKAAQTIMKKYEDSKVKECLVKEQEKFEG